jgi:hypothetical protein
MVRLPIWRLRAMLAAAVAMAAVIGAQTAQPALPSGPLEMRDFTLRFDPVGTFSLEGSGWLSMPGTWIVNGDLVTLTGQSGPAPCGVPGAWPSFRGPEASGSADGQRWPDRWNPESGEGILWRTPTPGLAHSSPVVWGDLVFVTTAISGRGNATFKPGLYGDGDASEDRSSHRWVLYAIDKRTGGIRWERTAAQGELRNTRHIKSTYASASPATDGRIVVAWFGSQGVFAYDMRGGLRWSVDLGRVDMGAYDIPAYEWGPASSPIIWNDLVIVQGDTQADSFLIAFEAATGETVWKTPREELPSWGTPAVVSTPAGPDSASRASTDRPRSSERRRGTRSRFERSQARARSP